LRIERIVAVRYRERHVVNLAARKNVMNLLRWEPLAEMNDLFNLFPKMLGRWPRRAGTGEAHLWSPPADISENGQEYLIRATLPSVKKEDVDVTLEDGVLTVSGERRQQEEQRVEEFHRVETLYGSFSRSFTLPEAIDATAIRAETKDGVLTIHLPKIKAGVKNPTAIKVQ
jgi:HSP20 family protein